MEREGSLRRISRSLHSRLKLGSGSSSSLTDLSQAKTPSGGGAEKVALVDEGSRDKGTQQRRAGANATWNSIHNAVISVFQRKDLGENELFTLNEGVRHLLKTELGSFFTEYLQKQLLTKGMVILRDKIRFYEGQKLLDSLADTWDFFFCDVLSMVQAIFCPVQGKEPSVRQLALLHFRNIITLNLKLEEALSRPRARVPPSIIQMLLILQGVHESKGVTDDYLRLECLIQKRLQRSGLSKWGNAPAVKNPVVRSKSYNVPVLSPVVEYDVDSSVGGGVGIRRHSVSEMTSCMEESASVAESSSDHSGTTSQNPEVLRSLVSDSPVSSRVLAQDTSSDHSLSSSPDISVDRVPESLDSEPDSIFLDFSEAHSGGATCSRQNVA
ncbi:proline-rich protein 5-like isoform X6 [Phyllopteryx taeniolatus]|uniref:proline-rich protein 5-like isoform X6 n=1 Tax=Phyllopteryx taeniolatus TaxID=161469 RepID=UPI002AD25E07|nr:proline-rich protein 5-like isoform X6 [Phyllopteryx taeniolatus]